jgi:hypothetical protein|tara:strand:+ start:299 stop:478 length:180 start_codon:yes stop_codon:yes gene_type:complete
MKKLVLIISFTGSIIYSCPYCAAGDTIGSSLSVYVPLASIIIIPFILSALFIYVTKKQK